MRSQLKRLAHSHSRLFSLAPTQAHSEVFFTHMLWRLPALWEGLPFYLQLSTQRMTDDHLRHLSGAIVHAPYRTGPSSRRVDSSILLILLLPPHPFCGAAGFFYFFHFFLGGRWVVVEGGCTTCGALITPSGNRHITFWFLGIFSFSLS